MIVGVGIDVCQIARMESALARTPRLEPRVFTEHERAYAAGRPNPAVHLAARFAAKEAALKALGLPHGLRWHDLEVMTDAAGAPAFVFSGAALTAFELRGAKRAHLSLSHDGGISIALVVLEGG